MKRKLFMATLICCLFCFGFIGIVNAKNGPSNIGELNVADYYVEDDYHSHYLYNPGGSEPLNPIEGTSYDIETNTLTLNNVKGPYEIAIALMGEDFKINVVGYNEIRNIFSYANDDYITNVNIIGDGTLVINKNKTDNDRPIAIESGSLIVGENVNLSMYAPETSNKPNYEPILIKIYSNNKDVDAIQFKNNQNVDITSESYDTSTKKKIRGVAFVEDHPYEFEIVTKDGKQYALETDTDEGKYYVSKVELMKINDHYFLDATSVENPDNIDELAYTYTRLEDVTADGYVIGDTVNINYRTYFEYDFYLLKDADGNEYTVYADDSRFVFDFSGETIKLADGNDYEIFKVNENFTYDDENYYVNGNKLSVVYEPGYLYTLKGTSFVTLDKEKKESNNPKTKDNIIEYLSILIISTYILIKRKA